MGRIIKTLVCFLVLNALAVSCVKKKSKGSSSNRRVGGSDIVNQDEEFRKIAEESIKAAKDYKTDVPDDTSIFGEMVDQLAEKDEDELGELIASDQYPDLDETLNPPIEVEADIEEDTENDQGTEDGSESTDGNLEDPEVNEDEESSGEQTHTPSDESPVDPPDEPSIPGVPEPPTEEPSVPAIPEGLPDEPSVPQSPTDEPSVPTQPLPPIDPKPESPPPAPTDDGTPSSDPSTTDNERTTERIVNEADALATEFGVTESLYLGASILTVAGMVMSASGCYRMTKKAMEWENQAQKKLKRLERDVQNAKELDVDDAAGKHAGNLPFNRKVELSRKLQKIDDISTNKIDVNRFAKIGALTVLASALVFGVGYAVENADGPIFQLHDGDLTPKQKLQKRLGELEAKARRLHRSDSYALARGTCGKGDVQFKGQAKIPELRGKIDSLYDSIQSRAVQIESGFAREVKFLPQNATARSRTLLDSMLGNDSLLRGARELGEGGFGKTFSFAFEGRSFVAKQAKAEASNTDIAREMAALEQLPKHRNITKYYGSIKKDGKWLLIFEKAESDLRNWDQPIYKHQWVGLFEGIQDIHKFGEGIAHKDIKPENILVVEDSIGNKHLKITDFGAAYSISPHTHGIVRTPGFVGGEITLLGYLRNDWKKARANPGTIRASTLEKIIQTKDPDFEKVIPGFYKMRTQQQVNALVNFARNFDARKSDIYALGETLNQKIKNPGPNLKKLIRKMKHELPSKRPDIGEVTSELKQIGVKEFR